MVGLCRQPPLLDAYAKPPLQNASLTSSVSLLLLRPLIYRPWCVYFKALWRGYILIRSLVQARRYDSTYQQVAQVTSGMTETIDLQVEQRYSLRKVRTYSYQIVDSLCV